MVSPLSLPKSPSVRSATGDVASRHHDLVEVPPTIGPRDRQYRRSRPHGVRRRAAIAPIPGEFSRAMAAQPSRRPSIRVMQPAEHWCAHDLASVKWLDLARHRRVAGERLMSS